MNLLAITTLICVIVAYFICGIPFGLIWGERQHVDVRKVGSGNIGMTNVARSVGAKAAALTFVGDMGKGLLCMELGKHVIAAVCFSGSVDMLGVQSPFAVCATAVFAACVLGHVYSPYLHFHGGKGISVGFGAGLGLFWPVGLGMLVVFLAFALPSRYVSLGSIMADISLPIQCMLWGMSFVSLLPVVLVCCVVLWSHHANIAKLVNHKESKFSVRHSHKES